MTVTELDLQFAAVTWLVNENITSLNVKEKDFIETLFTQYCNYARGSSEGEKRVRYLLDVLVGKARLIEDERPVMDIPILREQAVFGMFKTFDDDDHLDYIDEKPDEKQEPVVLYGHPVPEPNTQQIKRERQKIERTELMKRTKKQAVSAGARDEEIMSMLKLVAQQNLELRAQLDANNQALGGFGEATDANRRAMDIQFRNINKDLKKLEELYEMQLSKQSLTDLKWHQIPGWFREIYAGGIKRVAVGLIKLPFKIASISVDRIIYRPMVRAYDFWGGKVELVIGTIYWAIVIAGVIHIYQQTDWESVNNTYRKYGGDVMDTYLFSGIGVLKTASGYFPRAQEVANSVKIFFFQNLVTPIIGFVYSFWQTVLALLTVGINSALSKMPYANYWFTPSSVAWPDTPLFQALKEYFQL